MNISIQLTCAILFAFSPLVHAQTEPVQSAPFPTEFAAGEQWTWSLVITPDIGANGNRTRTVVQSSDGLVFQNHRGKTTNFKATFESNPFFGTTSLSAFREWPLEVGKTWEYKAEFMNGEASLIQIAKVLAVEDVTVPAGTFKAYKIVYSGKATKKSGYTWNRTDTHWYAPSVKADVKSLIDTPDHKGVMELLSYKTAP